MANINNLKRQHKDVMTVLNRMNVRINNGSVEEDAKDIAKDVSVLAGVLRIHLNEEDRSLYPNMIKSDNKKILEFHNTYKNEMEGIFNQFMDYKSKYNTRSKILSNSSNFIKDSNNILEILFNRISKEDKFLYPYIEQEL